MDKDQKPSYYKLPPVVFEMFNQLGKMPGKNKNKWIREWVVKEWIQHKGQFFIELLGEKIYFLDQETKDEVNSIINNYKQTGIEIDRQTIEFIQSKYNGFSVEQ